MQVSIPILIEATKRPGGGTAHTARPLFLGTPVAKHDNLSRMTSQLARDLGKHLDALGKDGRQDDLARALFNPPLTVERWEVPIELRKRIARVRFLFVVFRQLGRRIAFTPALPLLWFDLDRQESLQERATGVLTSYFRDFERERGEVIPEEWGLAGTAWVQPLELDIHPAANFKPIDVVQLLMMGGIDGDQLDGAEELQTVGRCLDHLFPDELDPVLLRDSEANELQRLLDADDRRPVLLVGPRLVGKTALVHEYVRRTVDRRSTPFQSDRNTWLLAPARLISGMSYVGQWENRLLAIVQEAKKRNHLLYFDDLVGLFRAGQTSQSSLNAAMVLKPFIERREVRIVAETTPEVWRVLREKDRSFADLFHLTPIRELNSDETLRVLIGVQRGLESKEQCEFDLEVIPTVVDLQRRYVRDTVFPGKATLFLKQLAVKYRRSGISRSQVLAEFRARSGLNVSFLDTQARLERDAIIAELSKQVVGQLAAVEAAADVISIAKARLNDPDRPLASFLFLGPTGVGKTQCAKAIAKYLFTDADRLLRYDMNEYIAPGSAARLVGTFDSPEGLLTAAVRRQPFAVILFDEIEKAHPEVFDLLLAVLGEGRMTDALGRTTDFTNTLIILTSNLGVSEAEGRFGFGAGSDQARDKIFVRSAQRFFRPEFFNRLDRVIPFHRLPREHIRDIARLLIQEVFRREGLVQRRVMLRVDEEALEKIADRGFDPELGARALKRSIERQITQPVGERLAAMQIDAFTVIRVLANDGGVEVRVQGLDEAPRIPPDAVTVTPERLAAFVERIEGQLASLRPVGPISHSHLSSDQLRYFALKELFEPIRQAVGSQAVEPIYDDDDLRPGLIQGRSAKRSPFKISNSPRYLNRDRSYLREAAAALNIDEYLDELAGPRSGGEPDLDSSELLGRSYLVQAVSTAIEQSLPDAVLLVVRTFDPLLNSQAYWFRTEYRLALGESLGVESEDARVNQSVDGSIGVVVRGVGAAPVLVGEVGTHLIFPKHAAPLPIQVAMVPLPEGKSVEDAYSEWLSSRESMEFGPVVRLYHVPVQGPTKAVDLRTGQVAPMPGGGALAGLIRLNLAPPPELVD